MPQTEFLQPIVLLEPYFRRQEVAVNNWKAALTALLSEQPAISVDNLLALAVQPSQSPHYAAFIKILTTIKPNEHIGSISRRLKEITHQKLVIKSNSINFTYNAANEVRTIIFSPNRCFAFYHHFFDGDTFFECRFVWSKGAADEKAPWHFIGSVGFLDQKSLVEAESLIKFNGYKFIPGMGVGILDSLQLPKANSVQFCITYSADLSERTLFRVANCVSAGPQIIEQLACNSDELLYSIKFLDAFHLAENGIKGVKEEIYSYIPSLDKRAYLNKLSLKESITVELSANQYPQMYLMVEKMHDVTPQLSQGLRFSVFYNAVSNQVDWFYIYLGSFGSNNTFQGMVFQFNQQDNVHQMEILEGHFVGEKMIDGVSCVYKLSDSNVGAAWTKTRVRSREAESKLNEHSSLWRELQIEALVKNIYYSDFDFTNVYLENIHVLSHLMAQPRSLMQFYSQSLVQVLVKNLERLKSKAQLMDALKNCPERERQAREVIAQEHQSCLRALSTTQLVLAPTIEEFNRRQLLMSEQLHYASMVHKYHTDLLLTKRLEQERFLLHQNGHFFLIYRLLLNAIIDAQVQKERLVRSTYNLTEKVMELQLVQQMLQQEIPKSIDVFMKERQLLRSLHRRAVQITREHERTYASCIDAKAALLRPLVDANHRLRFFSSTELIPGFTGMQLSRLGSYLIARAQSYFSHLQTPWEINGNRPLVDLLQQARTLGWNSVLCGSAFRGGDFARDLDVKISPPGSCYKACYNKIVPLFRSLIVNATKIDGFPEYGRLTIEIAGPKGMSINIVICFFNNEDAFSPLYAQDVVAKVDGNRMMHYDVNTGKPLDSLNFARTIITQKLHFAEGYGLGNKFSALLRVLRDIVYLPPKEDYNKQAITQLIHSFRQKNLLPLFKKEIDAFFPKVVEHKQRDFAACLSYYLPEWRSLDAQTSRHSHPAPTRYGIAKFISDLIQSDKARRQELVEQLLEEQICNKLSP